MDSNHRPPACCDSRRAGRCTTPRAGFPAVSRPKGTPTAMFGSIGRRDGEVGFVAVRSMQRRVRPRGNTIRSKPDDVSCHTCPTFDCVGRHSRYLGLTFSFRSLGVCDALPSLTGRRLGWACHRDPHARRVASPLWPTIRTRRPGAIPGPYLRPRRLPGRSSSSPPSAPLVTRPLPGLRKRISVSTIVSPLSF
jgi:hypothetical protein